MPIAAVHTDRKAVQIISGSKSYIFRSLPACWLMTSFGLVRGSAEIGSPMPFYRV